MHSPLSMQDAAHLRDASGPRPVRTMSSTPLMTSFGFASLMTAGPTLGQTSTHLPHFVQASSMRSTRRPRAVSKETSFIGCKSSALAKACFIIALASLHCHPAPVRPRVRSQVAAALAAHPRPEPRHRHVVAVTFHVDHAMVAAAAHHTPSVRTPFARMLRVMGGDLWCMQTVRISAVDVTSVSTDENAYEGEDCCHHGRHVRNWRGCRGSTRKNGCPDRLGRTRQVPRGRDPRAGSRQRAWHRPLCIFCRSLTLGRDETCGGPNRRSRVAHRRPD